MRVLHPEFSVAPPRRFDLKANFKEVREEYSLIVGNSFKYNDCCYVLAVQVQRNFKRVVNKNSYVFAYHDFIYTTMLSQVFELQGASLFTNSIGFTCKKFPTLFLK